MYFILIYYEFKRNTKYNYNQYSISKYTKSQDPTDFYLNFLSWCPDTPPPSPLNTTLVVDSEMFALR